MEDFIAIIEGRESLLREIASAPSNLQLYLSEAARELLAESRFLDALPGFLLGDPVSQQRVPIVLQRLQEIAKS